MRNLFFLLVFAAQTAYGQCCPYLSPVQILPPNPTPTDDVRLVFQATTPCLGNKLATNFAIVGNTLTFTGCYYSGMLTQPQRFSDTVRVGRLPVGSYAISFIGKISSSPQQCTELQSNSNIVAFQVGNALVAKAPSAENLSVYPVPASGRSLSLLVPATEAIHSLLLLDVLGRQSFACAATALVRQGNQYELKVPDLTPGAYTLKITLANGHLLTQRVILK